MGIEKPGDPDIRRMCVDGWPNAVLASKTVDDPVLDAQRREIQAF